MSEEQDEMGNAGGALASVIGEIFRGAFGRARGEVDRAAHQGRALLELRQLKRDRTVMYSKLGREVRALIEGGELDHPGLQRGLGRIARLDETIEAAEARLSTMGVDPEEAGAEVPPEQDPDSPLAGDGETR